MFKLLEYTNSKNHSGYSFMISNPYNEDEEDKHYCQLHVIFGSHSWVWSLPEFFKPQREWVDTSKYSWSTSPNSGYWNYIRKEYGFHILEDYVHVHYGIQPGCWSSSDKTNSDHTKLFGIPWKQKNFVYEKFWTPEWEVYDIVEPKKSGRTDFNRLHTIRENIPKVKFKFNDFDGEEMVATCHIIERRWDHGTGWCKWLNYFVKPEIIYYLELEFSNEVGKRKGSWKGGTLGHSTLINYKENPLEAFMRYGSDKENNFTNIEQI